MNPQSTPRIAESASLITEPNLYEPGKRYFWPYSPGDDFYEALIEAHRDLSDDQSQMLNWNKNRILLRIYLP